VVFTLRPYTSRFLVSATETQVQEIIRSVWLVNWLAGAGNMLSSQDISFVFNYWTLSSLGPTRTAAFVLISFFLFLIFLFRFSQVFSPFYKIILFVPSVSLNTGQIKVKCTVVLRPWTGRTAHRGSRGIIALFLDHGTRREWVVSVMSRSLFTSGKDPVTIVQEAGWATGPVWTVEENLTSTGIWSPRHVIDV